MNKNTERLNEKKRKSIKKARKRKATDFRFIDIFILIFMMAYKIFEYELCWLIQIIQELCSLLKLIHHTEIIN